MRFTNVLAGTAVLNALGAIAGSTAPNKLFDERALPDHKRTSKHLRPEYANQKRAYAPDEAALGSPDTNAPGYLDLLAQAGEPLSRSGTGGVISGGTNPIIDVENPSNLGQESTDAGVVVNLKWRFSDSKTRQLRGGWTREQVITDLPASRDIAGAQQHLRRGAVRELHWHRVAEWGFVYRGSIALSAVDENGANQWEVLNVGDIWYFPKGQAHGVQGLEDDNEFLLVFDDGNFDAAGTTFNVDDWIAHTPRDILAKNFGVNASLFNTVPSPNPYIAAGNGTPSAEGIDHPYGDLGASTQTSNVIHNNQVEPIVAPGGGGTIQIFDSRSFPISQTIAAAVVTLRPGALRELHWHPTAEEWVYFLQGQARATAFIGPGAARTFDFSAGDTAVFPDNSGHYVINTSNSTDLVWIEIYKADRVADISLTQWLALTPAPVVSQVLNISIDAVRQLKKQKQLIIA